jgi:hypothetical protein
MAHARPLVDLLHIAEGQRSNDEELGKQGPYHREPDNAEDLWAGSAGPTGLERSLFRFEK